MSEEALGSKKKNRGISFALLPVAGLGNKLSAWAKAAVFAHQNRIPLAVAGWSWPRPRALLRGGRGERQYRRYFGPRYSELARAIASIAVMPRVVVEPGVSEDLQFRNAVYVFNKMPHLERLFRCDSCAPRIGPRASLFGTGTSDQDRLGDEPSSMRRGAYSLR